MKRCAKDADEIKEYMKVLHAYHSCVEDICMVMASRVHSMLLVIPYGDAQKQSLGANLNPDNCKLAWLAACATFPLPGVVVVPKRIQCSKVLCNQSPFYSNCGKRPLPGL